MTKKCAKVVIVDYGISIDDHLALLGEEVPRIAHFAGSLDCVRDEFGGSGVRIILISSDGKDAMSLRDYVVAVIFKAMKAKKVHLHERVIIEPFAGSFILYRPQDGEEAVSVFRG